MMISMILTSSMMAWSMKSANPVKTSVAILTLSLTMFFTMATKTSSSWIPLILSMLFMGGIILMFMILSSILPNEKSFKVKNPMFFLVILFLIQNINSWSSPGDASSNLTKTFLLSGENLYTMMILILVYFMSCMSILSTEGLPMRTTSCC